MRFFILVAVVGLLLALILSVTIRTGPTPTTPTLFDSSRCHLENTGCRVCNGPCAPFFGTSCVNVPDFNDPTGPGVTHCESGPARFPWARSCPEAPVTQGSGFCVA